MQIRFISLIPVLIVVACAPQQTLTAELTPRTITAVNLEETVSRRDELMMAYSLTSYDAQNKPVGVVNGGWGVFVVRKGQVVDLQTSGPNIGGRPINLPLPRNGRIVASLVLIEVDNYDRANRMLEQVRRIYNVVAGPASLLLTATEVLTPLNSVAAGLTASGVSLKLVDQFDDDDLLGQSSVDLREAELRYKKQRVVRVPAVFTGQNLRDPFEYRLTYDLTFGTAQIQPVRQ